MEIRPYRESDEEICAAWFPPEGARAFMDERWLDVAARRARYEPEAHSLFVGEVDGEPVSVFSLSRVPEGNRGVVSLLVAPQKRRAGLAGETMRALRDSFPEIEEIIAYVDPDNEASVRMLQALGLTQGPSDVSNRLLFFWRRDGSPLPDDWRPPKVR